MEKSKSHFFHRACKGLLCIYLLTSCEYAGDSNKIEKQITTDPYIESFWNRNIKYALHNNPFGGLDTIYFDSAGNLSELHELGRLSQKMLYADKHMLIRHRISEDLGLHYLISYDTAENTIIQRWIRIMDFNWEYDPKKVNQLRTGYVIFIFNEENRLIKEIDLINELYVLYTYKSSILKQKTYYNLNSTTATKTISYTFDNNRISTIDERQYTEGNNAPILQRLYYFSDGLLDSTQRIDMKTITDHYKYVYF